MIAQRTPSFLAQLIEADLAAGKNGGRVVTRFPPEPNGFLHIGHAKSILINFGLAERYGGKTNLRFDDTNPTTEDVSYVEAIEADVRWLGCAWDPPLRFASDLFDRMYACAERLVRDGNAYVDSQPQEAIRDQRGSFDRPGVASPFRDRDPGENLDLLQRMRRGEFPDGACVLRARIDMAHPNVLMRDPLLYRIRHARHHRTGDAWCIYPMYDYAHPLEDAFEGVTHSFCTLEFESNRELYDWVLDHLGPWDPRPRQYEFARLALAYTVLSKRKLLQLVNERRVAGWDDPRMPTLAGLRRRGVEPQALRDFAELIGVAKNNSLVDIGKLELAIRRDLEGRSPRAMAVLDPLPVTLVNWPEDRVERLHVPWWPAEPDRGGRELAFGRDLLVEREDFAAEPPSGWKRLAPGREVRLAGAYVVRCEEAVRDGEGRVTELRCSCDLASGTGADGGDRRRVSGTIHWLHGPTSAPAEVRLYDRLFRIEQPDAEEDLMGTLNPTSLVVAKGARVEAALRDAAPGSHHQFLRHGYFFVDPGDTRPGAPVFNRTISLKDTWAARTAASTAAQAAGAAASGGPEAPRPARRARGPALGRPAVAPAPAATASAAVAGRRKARAEARASEPELGRRFEGYLALGLAEEEADLISGDRVVSAYFDDALQGAGTGPGRARSVARWLVNELQGVARDTPLDALPLSGDLFGRFVALVDTGRLTPASGKTLLARLASEGGDPEARMKELGLEKVEDAGVVETAIARVLDAQPREVERYRAGEKKVFGVLLGAAMRQTQGTVDATLLRAALQRKLG